MNFTNQVILLIGKTGAGKSTLGNMLLGKPHDSGPFHASADMDSVTKECQAATMSINGVMYNIVDTPGIFDTQKNTDEILQEIAKSVHKCVYGVKAIILIFEARRFTEEQKNALSGIRTFLGRDATNHIISVFSHATRVQIEDKKKMKETWNEHVSSFIQSIGNRWGISPDPHYFLPEDPIYKVRVGEIKELICDIRGVYTTKEFERNQQEQERIQRQKEEEERRKKQEYEERLKENARKEAEKEHKRQIEQMRREAEERDRRAEERERQMKQEQERERERRMKQEAEERERRMKQEAEERERRMKQERERELRQQERERELERERRQLEQKQEEGIGGSIATGALTGAAMGSFGGPAGAALGATVGTATGAVTWAVRKIFS